MHMTKSSRLLFLTGVVSSVAAIACSVAVKRDMSTIPAGQVGFDDMCGLQDYFDSIEAGVSSAPGVANSLDLEGGDGQKTVRGGRVRLVYDNDFLLKHVRRVLNDNWSRLPEELATAKKVEIEGRWAERAGIKRLVTDQDAVLFVDGEETYLPYQVCLSEFMFGAPLYKQRQVLMGLPDPSAKASKQPLASSPSGATHAPDGGAPAAVTGDAGAEGGAAAK
jgi:hypothetical protein